MMARIYNLSKCSASTEKFQRKVKKNLKDIYFRLVLKLLLHYMYNFATAKL